MEEKDEKRLTENNQPSIEDLGKIFDEMAQERLGQRDPISRRWQRKAWAPPIWAITSGKYNTECSETDAPLLADTYFRGSPTRTIGYTNSRERRPMIPEKQVIPTLPLLSPLIVSVKGLRDANSAGENILFGHGDCGMDLTSAFSSPDLSDYHLTFDCVSEYGQTSDNICATTASRRAIRATLIRTLYMPSLSRHAQDHSVTATHRKLGCKPAHDSKNPTPLKQQILNVLEPNTPRGTHSMPSLRFRDKWWTEKALKCACNSHRSSDDNLSDTKRGCSACRIDCRRDDTLMLLCRPKYAPSSLYPVSQ
ncbi:hypothetical protein FPANT_2834 [Fusarium pseudoanthophilum]|uniref:Uncharacterized protein n=1 Tax=Fusarium pseudoanthophilum TaxID=48495 RepID=A0A8H5PPM4_9HYPO|nr:hypothetical protein FPANT_2834 [Fusarium pseudoanthophilum]